MNTTLYRIISLSIVALSVLCVGITAEPAVVTDFVTSITSYCQTPRDDIAEKRAEYQKQLQNGIRGNLSQTEAHLLTEPKEKDHFDRFAMPNSIDEVFACEKAANQNDTAVFYHASSAQIYAWYLLSTELTKLQYGFDVSSDALLLRTYHDNDRRLKNFIDYVSNSKFRSKDIFEKLKPVLFAIACLPEHTQLQSARIKNVICEYNLLSDIDVCDHNRYIRKYVISVSPTLANSHVGESAWAFFTCNSNIGNPFADQKIKKIIATFADTYRKKLHHLYQKFSDNTANASVLLQFFIKTEDLDTQIYPSWPLGYPKTVFDRNGNSLTVDAILQLYRINPMKLFYSYVYDAQFRLVVAHDIGKPMFVETKAWMRDKHINYLREFEKEVKDLFAIMKQKSDWKRAESVLLFYA